MVESEATRPTKDEETSMANIAVIYYSATGNVYELAQSVAQGATDGGANVRLLRVAELASQEVIDSRPAWRFHVDATAHIPVATNEDLRWADGLAFGSPTQFGNMSAQLKQFLDGTGPLWATGELANKTATAFTSAGTMHGGNEATILALYQTMYHWGSIIVAPGYTQPDAPGGGRTPYGTAHCSGTGLPDAATLAAARHQGRRLAIYTQRLVQR